MTIEKEIIKAGFSKASKLSARRAIAKLMTKTKGPISKADYKRVINIMDASNAYYAKTKS